LTVGRNEKMSETNEMRFEPEEAHELLQVVDLSYKLSAKRKELMAEELSKAWALWEGLGTQESLDAYNNLFNEYKKGYYRENPDNSDDDMAGYTHVAGYNILGDYTVEANMFEKEGKYYISFDGSADFPDWVFADMDMVFKDSDFVDYVNQAYTCFRTLKKELQEEGKVVSDNDFFFLGHSLGGSIASALSAGLSLGAFEDTETTTEDGTIKYGDFNIELAVCRIFGNAQEITKRDVSAIIATIPGNEVL
jgi:hypothetical protein